MKKYIIGILAITSFISACEKKVDPIDTFHVAVDYHDRGSKYLTNDVTLNPKDSIYFDVTITSESDMSYVEIQRNGVKLDTFRMDGQPNKKSFSFVKGYRVDSAAGDYTYRVLARDQRAIFLGDGGKSIKVTVKPDFKFWSYKIIQVPDSVNKTNKCYFASKDGKLYSYSDGAAASSTIDFGYYWDTTGKGTAVTTDDVKHSFYALSAAQPQLSYYDISSWTKNATVLKKMPNTVNFVSQLTSAGAIQTVIGGNMTTGTSSKVTLLSTSAGSNVVGFKTVDGKYGAILVRYVNGDSPNKETQMEIDVKVQN